MQEIVDNILAPGEAGDIARTLFLPYLNHAATMAQSEYATPADIDAAMRFGCGYPIGPLALIDTLGAGAVVEALTALHARTNDPVHVPARILVDHAASKEPLVAAGAGVTPAELQHTINSVGVVGTGTMASGIVEVFAKSGFEVVFIGRGQDKLQGVVDRVTASLTKAVTRGKLDEATKAQVLARLTGSTDRAALAGVDIVVEAIAEDLDLKYALFADLDAICKPGAILATTTSSLSIAECGAATTRPHDVIGMHFFNPAAVMKLVEVVTTPQTSAEVDETVRALCLATGKHPVSCGDRAGFIVNALLFPYLNDAVKLSESGTSMDTIDEAIKQTGGLPMGPFELLDVVGTDVSLAIERTLVSAFGHAGWEPAETLVRVVQEGRLGRKTKSGFRSY